MGCACGVIVLLLSPAAHAARPLSVEDTAVAGAGEVQFEVGWNTARWDIGHHDHALVLTPIVGLGCRLQAAAEIPWCWLDPAAGASRAGPGDASFALKMVFAESTPGRPGLAAKLSVKGTSGDAARGLGEDGPDASAALVATATIQSLALHLMMLHTLAGGGRSDVACIGAGLEAPLGRRTRLAGEIAAGSYEGRTHVTHALAGMAWQATSRATLDAAVRFGLDPSEPRWSFVAGLALVAWSPASP
jgi:hypothetical protein